MSVSVNQVHHDIKVQDILDSHNSYNGTNVADINSLTSDEIISAIENSNDIMVSLLGEEFEGEYNITLV